MKLLRKHTYLLILLAIIFLAVKPLLHPGLPPTHDGENHVIRVYEFDKALRDGDFYPRWAADLNSGYGIPLFNYVYPMPNYFGALFHAFGASFIDAFKLNLLFATLIGVLFFYFWSREFFSEIASLTAATFYAFSPYRFVDIYVRGSVGEVWALAFFPAFLWSITRLFKEEKMRYAILASFFLAGTIFSHNILALMCIAFGFFYTLFLLGSHKWGKRLVLFSALVFSCGLMMSAIFWLPALLETKYTQGLQIYNIDANFPELYQLLFPSWGTGFSGGNLEDEMSFQIGVANLFVVLCGLVFLFKKWRKKYTYKNILLFFLLWFSLVFYIMLFNSRALWHTIPFLDYFQFPWRFLSLMIVICSFIAGLVIETISSKKRRNIIAIVLMVIAVMLSISYTKPAYYHNRTDSYYLTRSNFIYGTNSPGDVFNTIWMNRKLKVKKGRIEVIHGRAQINIVEVRTSKIRFSEDGNTDSKLIANVAYFPGWTLYVDGKKTELQKTKNGLISFSVPKGKHTIDLKFNDTMIRRVSSVVSIVSIIGCLSLWFLRRKFEDKV